MACPACKDRREAIGGPLGPADRRRNKISALPLKPAANSRPLSHLWPQSSWATSASLRASVFKQFGGSLQPFSPDPAKHTVTPKIDNKARSIVKGQPYCKLELIASRPNSRDRIARVLTQRDHIARATWLQTDQVYARGR
jgi:hypothetical protein